MWDRIVGAPSEAFPTLSEAAKEFSRDRANRMAAAVAYRTMFAMTPLLLIAVSVFGLVVGSSEEARQSILDAIEGFVGPSVASAIDMLMISAAGTSGVTAAIGFVLFIWTASTLFTEVQNSLNDIFGVPYEATAGLIGFVKKRGIGFLWALSLGLLVIAVWLINAVWNWIGGFIAPNVEPVQQLMAWMTPLISLALLPVIFALCFVTMTAADVQWKAAWKGGFFTAVIFVLTAVGSRIYFAWDSETSAPQVAGGVFLLMLLAYLLSSAFLVGAQMTRIYNDRETVATAGG